MRIGTRRASEYTCAKLVRLPVGEEYTTFNKEGMSGFFTEPSTLGQTTVNLLAEFILMAMHCTLLPAVLWRR